MKSPLKGRGAANNPPPRYLSTHQAPLPEEAGEEEPLWEGAPSPRTSVSPEGARTVLSYNRSPDIPFDRSINPYRGCEHGCIYCYARPTHAYLDLSPGLDFETRLYYKDRAAPLLRRELAHPGYRCRPIALGSNTDPYQPVERRLRVTRSILELLHECSHPLTIVTKSALVERDLDLLAPMAARGLVRVALSVTTLNVELARRMEPRATAPRRRLRAIQRIAAAGVPVGVMFAPVIPAINDHELEGVLSAAAAAGAESAGYVMLRLPLEVAGLFEDWLRQHYPERCEGVLRMVRELHGGALYRSRFGARMRGTGNYAELTATRFHAACRRLKLNRGLGLGPESSRRRPLRDDLFQAPRVPARAQLSLL